MFDRLKREIAFVQANDPAARNAIEVMLLYPGFRAVRRHRLAHWLYAHNFRFLARLRSERTRKMTGIEIHPGARIGECLFIDHGTGVVIGETTIIGNNCVMYQGCTLGGTGKEKGKRHPTLGNNIMVGAGAKVLGSVTIGDGAKIAAGAVVVRNVPAGATAIGIPACLRMPANKANPALND